MFWKSDKSHREIEHSVANFYLFTFDVALTQHSSPNMDFDVGRSSSWILKDDSELQLFHIQHQFGKVL